MGPVGPLLERAQELDAVQRALAGTLDGRGALVVFRGAAGLGKSSLLSAGADAARADGTVVLTARASSLESHIPFGLARKLVGPWLRDAAIRERVLAGDGALANPLFSDEWERRVVDDVAIGVQEGLCAMLERHPARGRSNEHSTDAGPGRSAVGRPAVAAVRARPAHSS